MSKICLIKILTKDQAHPKLKKHWYFRPTSGRSGFNNASSGPKNFRFYHTVKIVHKSFISSLSVKGQCLQEKSVQFPKRSSHDRLWTFFNYYLAVSYNKIYCINVTLIIFLTLSKLFGDIRGNSAVRGKVQERAE